MKLKRRLKLFKKTTGHKGKKLFMPIRVATTGQTHGLICRKQLNLLGKEKVKSRVTQINLINKLPKM